MNRCNSYSMCMYDKSIKIVHRPPHVSRPDPEEDGGSRVFKPLPFVLQKWHNADDSTMNENKVIPPNTGGKHLYFPNHK